ncbi:MAG TPA: heparan-alpha-glucosaminide N-acetyltransferase domain-containing protein [Anaerolineae bacterium]|nr:heparan-alpha-glucosaminide N-acetyltransferase domain-containing protein [Anaerolineae bacterium]
MVSEQSGSGVVDAIRQRGSRLFAVDALRGLIIVFMALDHANYFVAQKHPPGEIWDGVYPVYTSTLPFLTRWVTHLAAPGFFLLMGAGMMLFARSRQEKGWSKWAIIRHFLIRGLVLIALQLLIVNRAWELSPQGWGIKIYIGVLCALGGTMILASLLLWLKPPYLLALALALFVGIEFLHPGLGMWNQIQHDPVNAFLLRPGGTPDFYALYPILPWLELVTFGLALGYWLRDDPRVAFSRAWKLGLVFLLAFTVVRYLDAFGNIRPRMSNSWIDFLNPVKYPPSMTFTLMTTGVNLILLWLFSRARGLAQRVLKPLTVFGRTPLFFYVLHLFLYLGIGYVVAPRGTSIPIMYPFWLLGLLILFPLCWWYGRFKQRQPVNSLLRFL